MIRVISQGSALATDLATTNVACGVLGSEDDRATYIPTEVGDPLQTRQPLLMGQ